MPKKKKDTPEEPAPDMETLEREMWPEAVLLEQCRTGDILLVPMRVKKNKPDTIELRPLHDGLKTATVQSGPGALYLLFKASETCSMCGRYRAFRDIPDEGHCECEGRVEAMRESCINFRGR